MEKAKKTRKYWWIWILLGLVFAGGIIFFSTGNIRAYQHAQSLETSGDAAAAQTAFEALGNYSDSVEHVNANKYQQALALETSGDAAAAQTAFEALGNYSDSVEHVNANKYQQALALETSGDAAAAQTAFEALGGYSDSAEHCMINHYAYAVELESQEKYTDALTQFASIAGYKDVDTHIITCSIGKAQVDFDSGNYKQAQETLLTIPLDSAPTLLSACNDQCFVLDLASALNERWKNANNDMTTWTDKQISECYSNLVNIELNYLSKYNELTFSDNMLAEYAHGYIAALYCQLAGAEYYGVDTVLFDQNWTTDGILPRYRYIYWINRRYGLAVSDKEALKEAVENGRLYDMRVAIGDMLTEQLSNLNYQLEDSNEYNTYLSPFVLQNTTDYNINFVSITAKLQDKEGKDLDSQYVLYATDIAVGSSMTSDKVYFATPFDQLVFVCEFDGEQNGNTIDSETTTIIPANKIGWRDGKLTGESITATTEKPKAAYSIEDLNVDWEYNNSWSKNLYVPTLKFSVKNIGDEPAKKITVRVTFLNQDTKEIWSEESVYVVSSSDSPLSPSFKKKTFVYSSVGYETTPSSLPNITADIYINDELIQTVDVHQ